jgi:acid phosphatase
MVIWLPVPQAAAQSIPIPAHIVIVVEENHSSVNVIGNNSAPFMNQLAAGGALMTQSYAETHPSEPNYLALFSGSTFGLTSDACPVDAGAAPNLASELLASGYTFAGFSEGLPAAGSPVCAAGKYARKHVPWANFTNVPPETSLPFAAFNARTDYSSLPTVSFVIPNLDNDMHDGTIAQADTWLQ